MRHLGFALILYLAAATLSAQKTLELSAMHRAAIAADPRLRQLELEAAQMTLRMQNISAERFPTVTVEGDVRHQSEVVEFPVTGPAGAGVPAPPRDSYELALRLEKSLLDPTTRVRVAAEEARLAEAQARIRTAVFGVRSEVNEAFFAAALLQEREAQISTGITDLEARLREATLRVEQGVALPSEAESIEASLLQRKQEAAEIRSGRRAALARMSQLTGHEYTVEDGMVVPHLDARYAEAKAGIDTLRARPEFAQFARARERLETQKRLVESGVKPRVSAYGMAAYGSPGFDFLRENFHPYWLAGIRVQWKPWTWGSNERERELLTLQQEAITADEEAFERSLRTALQNDLATIDHLKETAALDARIVLLRESIERETRARYDERVVTAAEYVDRETDVLDARLLQATHRVQLAQAQARLLTLLGLEVQ